MLQPRSVSNLLLQAFNPSPLTAGEKPLSISLLSPSGEPLCSCTSSQATAAEIRDQTYEGYGAIAEVNDVGFRSSALNPSDNLNAYSLMAMNAWNRHIQDGDETDWLEVTINKYNVFLKAVGSDGGDLRSSKWLLLMVCGTKYPKGLALRKLDNLAKVLQTV